MSGAIYVIQNGSNKSIKLDLQAYAREKDFQQLLQDFPELLAGEQMNPSTPRKWLFVDREVPVPSEADGAGRWSLDHLFIDQDAIPTLVEVKRKSDTRLRREVVGQMLDYAANATAYLPDNTVQDLFAATCEAAHEDADAKLAEFLEGTIEPAAFWEAVQNNLRQGKVRLVFVADLIPPELQRIVEFLNEQMSRAEVLAVEIRQYAGEGFSTHIPRVLGQTAVARERTKSASARGKWTEADFFAAVSSELNEEQKHAITLLHDFAKRQGATTDDWGSGNVSSSLNPKFSVVSRSIAPFTVRSDGTLWLKLAWLHHNGAQFKFRKRIHSELRAAGVSVGQAANVNMTFTITEWTQWTSRFMLAMETALADLLTEENTAKAQET
jgi:hypothetical protein